MDNALNSRNYAIIGSLLAIMLTATLLVVPQQLLAQNSKKYPVEVVSSEIKSKHVEDDGTEVKEKQQTVKPTKETYEELVADNQEYFDYLISTLGEEEGRKIVDAEKERLKQLAKDSKDVDTIEAVEVGAHSITFGKALRETSTGPNKDPVNLVWYNNGRVVDVDTALRTKTPVKWVYGAGSTLKGYIDDTAHGGTAYWKNQDFQFEDDAGDFFTTRYHIRVYDGNYDSHTGGYRFWTMGGVHHEKWDTIKLWHVVTSWDSARNYVVENSFKGQTFVNKVGYVNLNNAGTFEGVSTDGWAGFIDLK